MTAEQRIAILRALREGRTRAEACKLAKMAKSMLDRWIDAYDDFAEEVELAEAEAALRSQPRAPRARDWRRNS